MAYCLRPRKLRDFLETFMLSRWFSSSCNSGTGELDKVDIMITKVPCVRYSTKVQYFWEIIVLHVDSRISFEDSCNIILCIGTHFTESCANFICRSNLQNNLLIFWSEVTRKGEMTAADVHSNRIS